ncbi:MAG: hypothetical protein Q8N47_16460 [Bryobacterales bacterium]|nr:hypothetical protein [Bryobacterales bacterium]
MRRHRDGYRPKPLIHTLIIVRSNPYAAVAASMHLSSANCAVLTVAVLWLVLLLALSLASLARVAIGIAFPPDITLVPVLRTAARHTAAEPTDAGTGATAHATAHSTHALSRTDESGAAGAHATTALCNRRDDEQPRQQAGNQNQSFHIAASTIGFRTHPDSGKPPAIDAC